nr:MAG TPA: hypothetical protein [Caudoviricetes sp.]
MGAGFILPVERISTTNTSYGYFSHIILPVEYTVSKYVLDGYILFNNFCHVANSDFYKLIFNHVVTSFVYYIDVLV